MVCVVFCGQPDVKSERYIRVEDVEDSVDDVGDEMDVTLSSSSSSVHAE